ncbi:thioredoxin domain-containing protein 2-like [Haliotis rufescens]|uniref:thioredoxin domain-containing protein 2-like n=1 Tax=Haliotis rufescens TaxID=6454 RepID=UPI00201F3842|nr:thioredoxin domain-containing protein 2-like [Haliotis rufescens]
MDGASMSTYRSINNGQSETRILKAPQIPTIITTAPSSQETSPPSEAGTSTSLETQSLPEDKNEDVFDKTSPCSSATPTQKPSPGKLPSKEAPKEKGKVPLKETKSLSKGSKDETKAPSHEMKSPTQAPKPKVVKEDSIGKHKMVKEDSLTKADATKLKAEPQRVKHESQKVKEVPKMKPDPSKVQNIKILTKQTSNPKESTDATEKPKEDKTKDEKPKEDKTKEDKTKDEKPKEDKTKEDKTKEDKTKDEKLVIRRSFKHKTLERMERVSSLSEKPRILPKSGSLPRASVHSIEPQSSEEDSTSSLSKLSKCTSV